MSRLQGTTHLAFDLVDDVTRLVRASHRSVGDRLVRRVSKLGSLAGPARAIQRVVEAPSTAVYATILGVNRAVRAATDFALSTEALTREAPERVVSQGESPAAPHGIDLFDRAQTVLNGVWGSHLSRREHLLDLGLTVRDFRGRIVDLEPAAVAAAFPEPTSRLAVFIHGSSNTEGSWRYRAVERYGDPRPPFATALAEIGYTSVFLRYNTGRPVRDSGRDASRRIAALVAAFPAPVTSIVLVGHSMGGLVSRSAVHFAHGDDEHWLRLVTDVFCLGTPLFGAPLARGAHALARALERVDAEGARVVASVIDARSDGLKDLRHGAASTENGLAAGPETVPVDRPLPPHIRSHFIGATIARNPSGLSGRWLGDALVTPRSATGQGAFPALRVPHHSNQVIEGLNHLDLTSHPRVLQAILAQL